MCLIKLHFKQFSESRFQNLMIWHLKLSADHLLLFLHSFEDDDFSTDKSLFTPKIILCSSRRSAVLLLNTNKLQGYWKKSTEVIKIIENLLKLRLKLRYENKLKLFEAPDGKATKSWNIQYPNISSVWGPSI